MAFVSSILAVAALGVVGKLAAAEADTGSAPVTEFRHTGGGPTSIVMNTVISKLPPVAPPASGVRDGNSLMRTVRLSGDYQSDAPLILPSYTRLVLDGSMTALPSDRPGPGLRWTNVSAGSPNETAAMVSVKGQQMVSIEGGQWTCAGWNSSAAHGNTTTVTAIYFEDTSFSFIRNLKITACGMYSGGNNSASIGNQRPGYVSGNIRVAAGGSNVIENVESSHSSNRGIWVQSQKLVVSGGSYHHNDADGIDIDSSSSHNTIHNASFYMNSRCGVFMEFSASYNTVVGNTFYSNHFNGVGTGSLPASQTYNVILANVLGPSDYPAGCPVSERPCPSYCPVKDSCEEVVGLPCGTCHYIDQKGYSGGGGMGIGSTKGIIAVLNDLGGSTNAAGGRDVHDALIALNYNGTIDNSDDSPNTTAYSFNPDAK